MANEAAILLISEPALYYSQLDEDHFFAWLQSIPAIEKVTGGQSGLELIVRRPVDRESLYDLIALMTRYNLDRRPLRPLCDEQEGEYFRDKGKYWHSAIYA